jgi:hypothetical protein
MCDTVAMALGRGSRERPADVLVQWENRRLLSGLLGHSPIRALVPPWGGVGHIMAFGPGFPLSFRARPGAAGPEDLLELEFDRQMRPSRGTA